MAKAKENKSVQNRIIYSRASYLYQAASYLAKHHSLIGQDGVSKSSTIAQGHSASATTKTEQKVLQNLSRQAVADLRAVTQKAQIRQSPAIKQTICKFCDTLQIEGDTCTSTVENASRGGRKPWADVLTIRCTICGNVKRYPVSAQRQKRKALRKPLRLEGTEESSNEVRESTTQATQATPDETPHWTPCQTPGP
ncbi:rnase p rpr2 rpp21 subunit domain-containing [Fusarium longipes]|uniref:Rnase p rpr2 rpp21 subunit domain-containing n=1 Tax=Fusarium longipes TaxID=694270 RepID=A0A395RMR7_9HYPO|nr:rnase p rpr2 rpp21 subunit domain-containing [Fusarium longipes]